MKKIITRIKGGLGNQLFCYAAARRLAVTNNAELVIDDVTGFARDHQYRQQYALEHFQIPVRKVKRAERMEPFERYRRGLMKWLSSRKPFAKRRYLEQEGRDFDARLLSLKVKGTLYLDGYWQSELYFKDVETIIRNDLRITPPTDTLNQHMAKKILNSNAVALHIRWFDTPKCNLSMHNLKADYYVHAIKIIEREITAPHYFTFSDNPDATLAKLSISEKCVTVVNHNRGNDNAYADLWLMTHCKHFIIANSIFSWWGAWLTENTEKIVVCPAVKLDGIGAWGFKGLLPEAWMPI